MSPPASPPSGTPASDTTAGRAAPGRVLADRYRLEEKLAAGGMAEVWRATDQVLQRQVAVKLLHQHLVADATFVARFRQEAVAAARLAHPGIVSIYDTCTDGDIEAIVMELLPGRTLRDRLDEPAPIDPWQAASLAAQIADALDAAHRAGLVHRDIKPANILLAEDGRVKVADFGIAKAAADADLTQPGLMVGTAKYLAPEQVTADTVDPRADIYSLGVVLYETLCGRVPFAGDTDAATALARLHRDPLRPRQVRPGVPRQLEEIVVRAMARQPDDRYPGAADLRAALLAAGADPSGDLTVAGAATAAVALPASAPRLPDAPPTSPPSFTESERSWLVPTVIVVLAAVALGVAGLLIGRSGAGNLIGGVRDALGGEGGRATAVEIVDAAAFDPPPGSGEEHNAKAPLIHDGDPTTAWDTENYDNPDITLLKEGVGIALELAEVGDLDRLELRSPTVGWQASIYVADEPADDLEGWGEPVLTSQEVPAASDRPASFDLDDVRGRAVLIWITNTGEPGEDGDNRVVLQEAEVFTR